MFVTWDFGTWEGTVPMSAVPSRRYKVVSFVTAGYGTAKHGTILYISMRRAMASWQGSET